MTRITNIWAADRLDQRSFPAHLRAYAETLMMVAAATGIGVLMAPRLGTSAVDLLYLVPVMAAASLYGLWPALTAGAVSALAYNFFFTEPVHSFRIEDPRNVVTVLMLFSVALVTSHLAARMRMQARIAAAHATRNAAIAGYARRLISCGTAAQVAEVTCSELAVLFGCNAVLLTAQDGIVTPVASSPAPADLKPNDLAAAAWVVAHGETAGRGSPRLTPADWLFHPIKIQDRTLAAVGLARDDGMPPVPAERAALLASLLDQTALALERVALSAEMLDVAQLRERDRLRGALLSSVGHDLRTPLTAILAAAAELRHCRPAAGAALVDTVEAEAGRLERYIANLLDMARIEAGAIRLATEPVDLIDAAAAAVRDLRLDFSNRVEVAIPPDLPLVLADPQLLHHCLINLLDNARRYSDPGSTVRIEGTRGDSGVSLAVIDEGQGLPEGGEAMLFRRFAHISGSDRKGGAGLGLAIVGGFADAMGIEAAASPRADAPGAAFVLRFGERLLMAEQGQGAVD